MHYDFYQQQLFNKRWFKLTDTGLRVRHRENIKSFEYELNFEEIGTKVVDKTAGLKGWILSASLFSLIAVVMYLDKSSGGDVESSADLFYASLGGFCWVLYFITFKRVRYLSKSNNVNAIEFLRSRSKTQELNDFIDQVISRRKAYLIARYGELNRNISYETQYHNLNWLLDNEVLNYEEFTEKKGALDKLFPPNVVVKGFAPS